jgi:diaminopimelate decarboxylase/aspartate kinase
MSQQWTVMKFGGTSVASEPQWATIAGLAQRHRSAGRRVLVVCSAMAGVTDALLEIAAMGVDEAAEPIIQLALKHRQLADDLGIDAAVVVDTWCRKLHVALDEFEGPRRVAQVAWLGEWILTQMGCLYLSKSLDAGWVDAREALQALPESKDTQQRALLGAHCESAPDPQLEQRWAALQPVLVTQGFVARSAEGDTVLLGRGGSDTSAALLASRLGAAICEIWTDVPGLFSADPRVVQDARQLRSLGYSEALEMAAGGARVIHPRCIRAAADAQIPIEIRDLSKPSLPGTCIGGSGLAATGAGGVKAVVCQTQMAVLLLENRDIRQQVGFLAWVFTCISEAGVSVDLVATSETTTTLAINLAVNHLDELGLEALAGQLRQRCRVSVFNDCACINLVGRGARHALQHFGASADVFDDCPLLMLSQSANDLCISLLVDADCAGLLLARMHEALIINLDHKAGDMVFGPTWLELQAADG